MALLRSFVAGVCSGCLLRLVFLFSMFVIACVLFDVRCCCLSVVAGCACFASVVDVLLLVFRVVEVGRRWCLFVVGVFVGVGVGAVVCRRCSLLWFVGVVYCGCGCGLFVVVRCLLLFDALAVYCLMLRFVGVCCCCAAVCCLLMLLLFVIVSVVGVCCLLFGCWPSVVFVVARRCCSLFAACCCVVGAVGRGVLMLVDIGYG